MAVLTVKERGNSLTSVRESLPVVDEGHEHEAAGRHEQQRVDKGGTSSLEDGCHHKVDAEQQHDDGDGQRHLQHAKHVQLVQINRFF